MIRWLLSLVVALGLCCPGMALADEWKDESGKGHQLERKYRDGRDGSYFHRHGYERLDIPRGHYPPPGECRIWYPERPAGHQPPPGDCGRLRRTVPAGAWLIEHPEKDLDRIHVIVYDERRPGAILVIGEFDLGGVFVRTVFER